MSSENEQKGNRKLKVITTKGPIYGSLHKIKIFSTKEISDKTLEEEVNSFLAEIFCNSGIEVEGIHIAQKSALTGDGPKLHYNLIVHYTESAEYSSEEQRGKNE